AAANRIARAGARATRRADADGVERVRGNAPPVESRRSHAHRGSHQPLGREPSGGAERRPRRAPVSGHVGGVRRRPPGPGARRCRRGGRSAGAPQLMAYPLFDPKLSADALEKQLLAAWKHERLFQKTQEAARYGPPFVFYEGPPTANGRPGIHHVFARTIKD